MPQVVETVKLFVKKCLPVNGVRKQVKVVKVARVGGNEADAVPIMYKFKVRTAKRLYIYQIGDAEKAAKFIENLRKHCDVLELAKTSKKKAKAVL